VPIEAFELGKEMGVREIVVDHANAVAAIERSYDLVSGLLDRAHVSWSYVACGSDQRKSMHLTNDIHMSDMLEPLESCGPQARYNNQAAKAVGGFLRRTPSARLRSSWCLGGLEPPIGRLAISAAIDRADEVRP
jgi:hypothetical protein